MSQCPRVVFAWSPCQPCPVTLCILIQILGIRQAIWSVRAMVCIVGSLWLWNEDRVALGSSWDNLYWMTTMGNKMKEKELYGLFHLVSLNKGSQNKKASPQSGLIFPQFWWPSGGLFFLYDAERHVTTTISIKSLTWTGTELCQAQLKLSSSLFCFRLAQPTELELDWAGLSLAIIISDKKKDS